jgi:DNA-binding transcriptional LysR family regulator
MVTLPRQLAARHAQRFGVTSVEPPLVLPRFQIRAVVPKVAMMDAGVSWLLDCLQEAAATRDSPRQRRHPRKSGHGVGRPQDRA